MFESMSNSTERVRAHRRRGVRCVTVRPCAAEIDTLLAPDYLGAGERQDAQAIKDATQAFVLDKLFESA